MGPEQTAPPPGSLTVPLLHGWVVLLVLVVLAIVVAVCFLLVSANTPSDSRSAEWRSWLEARSRTGGIAEGDLATGHAHPRGSSSRDATGGRSGTSVLR